MKDPFALIFLASKIVFSQCRTCRLWFLLSLVLALLLFVLFPVWSVPGNNIAFQLSLFTFGDWVLFSILALLIALLFTMQIFIFKRTKNRQAKVREVKNVAGGVLGACAGILGGVFGTAACSWCVAAVFGFLGTGAVLFIAENQFWATVVAISIMLVSLYFASRSVIRGCKHCEAGKIYGK